MSDDFSNFKQVELVGTSIHPTYPIDFAQFTTISALKKKSNRILKTNDYNKTFCT